MNTEQFEKVRSGAGFIAALDQSGGSTPKALKLYGIAEDAYSGDEEMFDLMHEMRARIITSPSFGGDRILGAILFENTMDREIEGRRHGRLPWNVKHVVPFLKVDKGLAEEPDGVQLMKPIPGLDDAAGACRDKGVFGTKMRSVIKLANEAASTPSSTSSSRSAARSWPPAWCRSSSPRSTSTAREKAEAEDLLKAGILEQLDRLADDQPSC